MGPTIAALTMSLAHPLAGQTRPLPLLEPSVSVQTGRPLPGPVYETSAFTRAVERRTRTRNGAPGEASWTQYARYYIDARLDPAATRVSGSERVVYLNNSHDTLTRVAVHLRQNAFAPGNARRTAVPTTGGMTLNRVAVRGTTVAPPSGAPNSSSSRTAASRDSYLVDGTVMWITLATPLMPRDSIRLDFSWSYSPAPAPSDGREGRESDVFFMGYWYPQVAVYDDVNGWVADQYLLQAEFYMDPADYDVRLQVPREWVVGATGQLQNPDSVLSSVTRARLDEARRTGSVVHVVTPGPEASRALAGTGPSLTWHFVARDVRDFAWGAGNAYVWDATRAIITGAGGRPDTVTINSFYRRHPPASAWATGGARYTRDAIEQLSAYLWPYPWPQMTSMEGILDGGGMEYPMMTIMQPWADTLSLAGDLMHETGHMWFPMQVGSNETRYPWMDEGFTQFDDAQGMRVLYGEPRSGGRPNDSEPGQRRLYLDAARAGNDQRLMVPGDLYPAEWYFIMYYDKTAQVLAALRGMLGEETFHRAFREYGHRWIDKHPYPYDFFNAIADVSGRDLSWFWTTWFYEPWSLDQAIASVSTVGDSTAITIEDRGLAPMPVRVAITRADGTVQRLDLPVDIWLTGARRHEVRVAGSPAITRIEIDPDAAFPDIERRNQAWTVPR